MNAEPVCDADAARVESLADELARWQSAPLRDVRLVRSPYRVCPLGAHVDHQGGVVTGMAIDRALYVAFLPRSDGRVVLRSRQFPGEAVFPADAGRLVRAGDWADYGRGAVAALAGAGRTPSIGMTALVDGHTDVGGLSSSAAVGVAYLLALEAVNDIDVAPEENIELDRAVENDFIGLRNGILDQSSILLGRRGHLMRLDCAMGRSELVPCGADGGWLIAVLFSGLRVSLAETDYNRRVCECREAARGLLVASGRSVPEDARLCHVDARWHTEHGDGLPEPLRRRARHYFTEQERVERGVDLWRRGDLEGFGALMTASGRSSVVDYDCGNAHMRTAYEALAASPGVYGARFSGAGFRGCCVALAREGAEEEMEDYALGRYLAAHPDMAGRAEVYFCRSSDGAATLDAGAHGGTTCKQAS